MNQTKKISIVAILALMVSTMSLLVSYSSLSATLDINGVAKMVEEKEEEIFKINIVNINDVKTSLDTAVFTKQPILSENGISLGVTLNQVNSYGMLKFDIVNQGNVEGKVTGIKITGIEGYEGYIKASLSGIKVGDVIKVSENPTSVNVTIAYANLYSLDGINPEIINLNDIKIELEIESV